MRSWEATGISEMMYEELDGYDGESTAAVKDTAMFDSICEKAGNHGYVQGVAQGGRWTCQRTW